MKFLQKQKEKINNEKVIFHGRLEGNLKEIKPHKIITGSIELKDKNGRCPVYIPEGYELRRFGAPNEIFEIVEGCLKPKNGEFFLKDTVTTFYLAKKALKTAM